jgi:hypothetical protein
VLSTAHAASPVGNSVKSAVEQELVAEVLAADDVRDMAACRSA